MNQYLKPADVQPHISDNIRRYFDDMSKGKTYLEEAEFGMGRILPALADLPPGARVLEIGSGPSILLAEITEQFPHLNISGIEPMSDGFAFFENYLRTMRQECASLDVKPIGYEDVDQCERWDLIFLINVFEHLPNWRDFLDFVLRSLKPKGTCVVLCPNYGFPYESHFKIPVLWNKALTQRVFSKHIARFELENDSAGLYDSLNFVCLKHVRREACRLGLALEVDITILDEMVRRLGVDPAFRERQKTLSVPARIFARSGVLKYLLNFKLVQNRMPYMQFSLQARGLD